MLAHLKIIFITISGLEAISQELGDYHQRQRLSTILQELFPDTSADSTDDDVLKLTKAYHRYKREYVKHQNFTPEREPVGE